MFGFENIFVFKHFVMLALYLFHNIFSIFVMFQNEVPLLTF